MTTEIIWGVTGTAFVVLVVYLISTLVRARKTLKKLDRVLHDAHHFLGAVMEPTVETIHHINKLTVDLTKKSEGLDVLFRPLYSMKPGSHKGEKWSHIIGCVIDGMQIFKKTREILGNHHSQEPARMKRLGKKSKQSDAPLLEVTDWITTGINLWKKFKS